MKKLFGILAMLMVTLSILGQNEGTYYNVLDDEPRFMRLERMLGPARINAYVAGDRSSYQNFEEDQYSFIYDDIYYIVSYDISTDDYTRLGNDERKERDIWLFAWTGNSWEKATRYPLQTDYIQNNDGVFSHVLYHPRSDKCGTVMLSKSGNVMIAITTVYVPDRTKPYNHKVSENIYNLVPSKGMYHISAKAYNFK